MRYHTRTTAERIRSWPPAVQCGHAASEVSRAVSLLESGAVPEAGRALMRARELLSVLETCPELPDSWGPALLEVIRAMSGNRLAQSDPAVWAGVYRTMMGLCEGDLSMVRQ